MKNAKKHLMVAALLLTAVAVPGQLSAQTDGEEGLASEATVTVLVENSNWLDMRVYAVRENGASDRIGTVTSFSSRKLELPKWLARDNIEVQLVAVPIGSTQRHASPPVIVSKGDVVEWQLQNNLALSSIFVR
jgi:hypothetical protein